MGLVERLTDSLSHAVAQTGPVAPLVLFGASFIEYVFPPFPGDTIVLLGAWYAVHGAISWPAAFAAVTAGAVAGSWVDWRVGCALAPRADGGGLAGRIDPAQLARFQEAYRRWGGLLLVANRFLPGIRAFLFVAAGATGIPLGRVLLLGGLSAALWNALLLAAGAFLVQNLGQLLELFTRYTNAAWVVMAVVAAGIVLRLLLRRGRGR